MLAIFVRKVAVTLAVVIGTIIVGVSALIALSAVIQGHGLVIGLGIIVLGLCTLGGLRGWQILEKIYPSSELPDTSLAPVTSIPASPNIDHLAFSSASAPPDVAEAGSANIARQHSVTLEPNYISVSTERIGKSVYTSSEVVLPTSNVSVIVNMSQSDGHVTANVHIEPKSLLQSIPRPVPKQPPPAPSLQPVVEPPPSSIKPISPTHPASSPTTPNSAQEASKVIPPSPPTPLDTPPPILMPEVASKAAPVSQPTGMERFVEVVQQIVPRSLLPQATTSVSSWSPGRDFVAAAHKLHKREGKSVPHVPFRQYWPSYDDMRPEQQGWYFYWRSEIRQGRFLPTDLSYIFVHVYEILNLVECAQPKQAAIRLWTLGQRYREQHSNLGHYLADWGGDLLGVHLGLDAAFMWWQAYFVAGELVPDMVVNAFIERAVQSRTTRSLPLACWLRLARHRPRSKFYFEHNQDGTMDRAYLKALDVLESYWYGKDNVSVLEKWTLPTKTRTAKDTFRSAVMAREAPQQLDLGVIRSYLGTDRLQQHLAAVLKYTDFLVRRAHGRSGKAPEVTLNKGLLNVLENAFPPQPKPPAQSRRNKAATATQATTTSSVTFSLDLDRAAMLAAESASIAALLEVPANTLAPLHETTGFQDGSARLLSQLTPKAAMLLGGLYQGSIKNFKELTDLLASQHSMPHQILDEINALAIDTLSEPIVVLDSRDQLNLTDAGRNTIREIEADLVASYAAFHSSHNAQSLSGLSNSVDEDLAKVPLAAPSVQAASSTGSISKMTEAEIELLRMILTTQHLTEQQVADLAHRYMVMPALLIDMLNEKLFDELGHTALYQESERWVFDDEDRAVLLDYITKVK